MSRCGTPAGAQAHYKRGETACAACRAAAAAQVRESIARIAVLRCSVDGCDRPQQVKARALCNKHYHQIKRAGAMPPLPRRAKPEQPPRPTFEQRFWSRVTKLGSCWLWTGGKNIHGYGQCKQQGRMRSTHRIAYELTKGAIPDGLDLDHLCRVRHCVNPAHLEPVTKRENNIRSEGFAGVNHRKTHCDNGHEFTAANTYIRQDDGGRVCRACHATRQRRYREAR